MFHMVLNFENMFLGLIFRVDSKNALYVEITSETYFLMKEHVTVYNYVGRIR